MKKCVKMRAMLFKNWKHTFIHMYQTAPSVPQERVALFSVGFCGKHTLKVLIILSFIVLFTMQFIPNGGFDKKL